MWARECAFRGGGGGGGGGASRILSLPGLVCLCSADMGKEQELLEAARTGNVAAVEKLLSGKRATSGGSGGGGGGGFGIGGGTGYGSSGGGHSASAHALSSFLR